MTGGDGVKDGGSLVRGGKVGEWRQGKNGEGGKAGWQPKGGAGKGEDPASPSASVTAVAVWPMMVADAQR